MKFLVPNYSCLQNPWLGGYHPQIPVLSVLNWICWPPPLEKNSWVRHWSKSKHNQLEHTDRKKPCCRPIGLQGNENADETDRNKLPCIGLRANRNTADWNKLSATSRTVSVCRGTKILSVGTKWPQQVVLYQSAGEQKTASWNKLDRTNETSYCFLLLSIITSQIKASKHRRDYYARSSTPVWRSKPVC